MTNQTSELANATTDPSVQDNSAHSFTEGAELPREAAFTHSEDPIPGVDAGVTRTIMDANDEEAKRPIPEPHIVTEEQLRLAHLEDCITAIELELAEPWPTFWLAEHGIAPSKAYTNDACYDLYLPKNWHGPWVLGPGARPLEINLGIHCDVPEGYVLIIVPRSGYGTKGLHIANAVGVIDCGYRGEIKVTLVNNDHIQKPVHLDAGKAILQAMFVKLNGGPADVQNLTDRPDEETERGDGGFGSTDG
ncbi:MAG: hypothetical protein AAF417_15070 [Pseudomonadota bacterium]